MIAQGHKAFEKELGVQLIDTMVLSVLNSYKLNLRDLLNLLIKI